MSDAVVGWVPEFPGQRPPFSPGNQVALKHGAYTPRKVGALAEEIVELYLADDSVSWLRQPANRLALWAMARAEARVQLLDEWVSEMPIRQAAESKQGQTSPLELLRRWEATASTHRARLGLDPLSRAKLGRDTVATHVDAASLLTKMRTEAESGGATDGE